MDHIGYIDYSGWRTLEINNVNSMDMYGITVTGVMTSEHVMEEKVFNDIVNGVYEQLHNEASAERSKINKAFTESFESQEVVKALVKLKQSYLKLEEEHAELPWYKSERSVLRKMHLLEEQAGNLTGRTVDVYKRTPSSFYSELHRIEYNKLIFPEYPDKSIVKAKLRLVKNLTAKTFEQLVKIAR